MGLPPPTTEAETLFYDGHCGLCHSAVKFVLKHDRSGTAFRFAPLQGQTFKERVSFDWPAGLPDSMVVRANDGTLLTRSNALVHILYRLGGGWKVTAALLAAVPLPVREALYNFVARIRYRIFGRRDNICPIVAPAVRERFDP